MQVYRFVCKTKLSEGHAAEVLATGLYLHLSGEASLLNSKTALFPASGGVRHNTLSFHSCCVALATPVRFSLCLVARVTASSHMASCTHSGCRPCIPLWSQLQADRVLSCNCCGDCPFAEPFHLPGAFRRLECKRTTGRGDEAE